MIGGRQLLIGVVDNLLPWFVATAPHKQERGWFTKLVHIVKFTIE